MALLRHAGYATETGLPESLRWAAARLLSSRSRVARWPSASEGMPSDAAARCAPGSPPGSWLVGFSVGGLTPSTVVRLRLQVPGGGLAVAGASLFLAVPTEGRPRRAFAE